MNTDDIDKALEQMQDPWNSQAADNQAWKTNPLPKWESAVLVDPVKQTLSQNVNEITINLLQSLGIPLGDQVAKAVLEFSQKLTVAMVDAMNDVGENRLDSHEHREHDIEML
jgi:hypothetical protein